jgi:hypothetical protein
MNKSRNSPISVRNAAKKTITNSARNTPKSSPEEKFQTRENQQASEKFWIKKPNDSWDY